MKILITGGDGFVGRHLCHRLSLKHKVYCVDNFRYGKHRILFHKKLLYEVHKCDIRDLDAIKNIICKTDPDIIYHLAAIHYIPECEIDVDLAISTNVIGTVNIARSISLNTRLIFISTAAVYSPDSKPHIENVSLIKPCDIYGLTKLHAENYLEYLTSENKLNTITVRLFNVIGPGETNPHVLPIILAQILNGRMKLKLGNINPKRDYIHVKDVVDGLIAIGTKSRKLIKSGEIFNLGTSYQYSVEELVNILSKIIGKNIIIEIDPKRVRLTDRPYLSADISKTKNLTGWKSKLDIRNSLEETLNNPDFSDSIIKEALS